MPERRGAPIFFLILALVLFVVLGQTLPLYTDWLWFQEVGLTSVFLTILWAKGLPVLVLGVVFFVLVYGNLLVASRWTSGDVLWELEDAFGLPSRLVIEPLFKRLLVPGALLLSLLAATNGTAAWDIFLWYRNRVPFGIQDPLFHRDLGFYVFTLPALRFIYGWLFASLGLIGLLTAATYLLYRGIQVTTRGLVFTRRARAHLFSLGAVLVAIKGWGFHLDTYDLLYSPRGVVFGAGYTDVNANLPALRYLLIPLSVGIALFLLYQIPRRGFKPIVSALILLGAVWIFGLGLVPAAIQRFRVVPNEIVFERPYIEHNVKYTRLAYGLDKIQETEFPAEQDLMADDIRKNDATIKNIRLWDHRPLLATYAQLQEIRTYYKFVDVDNDRYWVDGEYRQVMLSPRELSYRNLPSRIWINEHLTYTHGYGVVMGPVNHVTKEGLPQFYLKDIPPVASTSILVKRPEIYYGEVSNDYAFVRTKAQELDYPSGDANVYTTYRGTGGVPAGSFWRKLLFSARFGTLKILLSNDIVGDSRIMYNRQIEERVKKAAPFIQFDPDPYLVVSQDGRLYWIIDGYTVTDRYPYSEPVRGLGNYIRNSVKAVVDAYNGSLAFYISEAQDPLIRAYARAFPDLFKPLDAMPADLRTHIRYPQGMFATQARMYATYHMRDPQVFYNKEDLWSIPRKTIAGQERDMEPYYTIMRLAGEQKEEFILLLPFTPSRKDNMSAWLAARSDPPHYGKLIVYNFPKQKLVYGPRQVEALIDQDSFISQQLSLWNQRGSQVIRGSLLAIPIEKSLLYVEPLYLAAEKGSLPSLKRVIVAFGDRLAMEETLDQSLQAIFGGRAISAAARPSPGAPPPLRAPTSGREEPLRTLANRAWDHYSRAQEYLRQGNWAGYGEELKRLEGVLKGMREQK